MTGHVLELHIAAILRQQGSDIGEVERMQVPRTRRGDLPVHRQPQAIRKELRFVQRVRGGNVAGRRPLLLLGMVVLHRRDKLVSVNVIRRRRGPQRVSMHQHVVQIPIVIQASVMAFVPTASCAMYYIAACQRGPLRAPVGYLRLWLLRGIEPLQRQRNVPAFHPVQRGAVVSPPGGCVRHQARQQHQVNRIAGSSLVRIMATHTRQSECSCPDNLTKEHSASLGTLTLPRGQPSADWMPPAFRRRQCQARNYVKNLRIYEKYYFVNKIE